MPAQKQNDGALNQDIETGQDQWNFTDESNPRKPFVSHLEQEWGAVNAQQIVPSNESALAPNASPMGFKSRQECQRDPTVSNQEDHCRDESPNRGANHQPRPGRNPFHEFK